MGGLGRLLLIQLENFYIILMGDKEPYIGVTWSILLAFGCCPPFMTARYDYMTIWDDNKGSHRQKKNGILWKKFHKMVTPPPRTAFMKSLFRTLTVFLNTYAVLNKRYEIRLTPPSRLWKSFIKFRFFLNDGFPNHGKFLWTSYWTQLAFCHHLLSSVLGRPLFGREHWASLLTRQRCLLWQNQSQLNTKAVKVQSCLDYGGNVI